MMWNVLHQTLSNMKLNSFQPVIHVCVGSLIPGGTKQALANFSDANYETVFFERIQIPSQEVI